MTSCPIGPAEGERPLKGGLLLPSGRNRRGPEGSSRKANVRRCWDHRVETMTRTPCLEEMPITTEAATAVEASGAGRLSATDRSQTLRLKSQMAASVPGLFF